MNRLANDYPEMVLGNHPPHCLSLYQPTHRQHPQNLQDPIRFGNLVKHLSQSLHKKYPRCDAAALLAPLHELAKDTRFWNKTFDGLAVLVAADFFRVYRLQRPVAELAVVADSFHTKPLLRIMQSADRYQVLGVNRHEMRLFEGNRDSVDEIKIARSVPRTVTDALDRDVERERATRTHGAIRPGTMGRHGASDVKQDAIRAETEHFFRAVDRSVLEHHSRPSGTPLLLAAMPEHHHLFREVSRNPNLLDETINVFPDELSPDSLRERVWQLLQPYYLQRLAGLVDRFHAADHREQASDDLAESAKAAVAGRIHTLLLEAERQVPGRMDATTGAITPGEMDDPEVDDLLDDLGEQVLATGGEVVMVPRERMPTHTGLAAIYRY